MDPNFIPYLNLHYPHKPSGQTRTTAHGKSNKLIVLFRNGLQESDFRDVKILIDKLDDLRKERGTPIKDISWKDYTNAVQDYARFLGEDHDLETAKISIHTDIKRANKMLIALYNPYDNLQRWYNMNTVLQARFILLNERICKSHFEIEIELQLWLMVSLYIWFPHNVVLHDLGWLKAVKQWGNFINHDDGKYYLNMYVKSRDERVKAALISKILPSHLTPLLDTHVQGLDDGGKFWTIKKNTILSLIRGYFHQLGLPESTDILEEIKVQYVVQQTYSDLNCQRIASICDKLVMGFVTNPGFAHLTNNINAIHQFGTL